MVSIAQPALKNNITTIRGRKLITQKHTLYKAADWISLEAEAKDKKRASKTRERERKTERAVETMPLKEQKVLEHYSNCPFTIRQKSRKYKWGGHNSIMSDYVWLRLRFRPSLFLYLRVLCRIRKHGTVPLSQRKGRKTGSSKKQIQYTVTLPTTANMHPLYAYSSTNWK